MVKLLEDLGLITKVCIMYYKGDVSQKEIAARLNLSRATISRIIKKGRELGIVQVTIRTDSNTEHLEIELKLESILKTRQVKIVEATEDKQALERGMAEVAAQLLEQNVAGWDYVGVGGGSVLSEIPDFIKSPDVQDILVLPLIGELGNIPESHRSNYIAGELGKAFNGKSLDLKAPAVFTDLAMRNFIKTEPSVKEVLDYYPKLKVALFEIEPVSKEEGLLSQSGYFNDQRIQEALRKGAVGEICLGLYNKNGSTEGFTENDYMVGIDITELRNVQTSIALAHGKDKAESVIAAAKGGFMNILVTDVECADEIVRLASE